MKNKFELLKKAGKRNECRADCGTFGVAIRRGNEVDGYLQSNYP